MLNKVHCRCPVCRKEFERSPSSIKSKYQFCSRGCAYKGRSLGYVQRIIRKPYRRHRGPPKPQRQCLVCGIMFTVTTFSRRKYCSRQCFEVAHKTNMRGVNNPSYIDGRSKNKRCYRGDDWEQIRKQVYERDNWCCQVCGKHCEGHEIQAHHIEEWRKTKDNSLGNLITLCNTCHARVHNGTIELTRRLTDGGVTKQSSPHGLHRVHA